MQVLDNNKMFKDTLSFTLLGGGSGFVYKLQQSTTLFMCPNLTTLVWTFGDCGK